MALPAFGIPQQQTAVAVPACEVDVVLFSYSLRTSRTYSTNQEFFLENKSGLCFYVLFFLCFFMNVSTRRQNLPQK